jgi:hypothetical protein
VPGRIVAVRLLWLPRRVLAAYLLCGLLSLAGCGERGAPEADPLPDRTAELVEGRVLGPEGSVRRGPDGEAREAPWAFGSVADAVASEAGAIFVLDRRGFEIHRFGPDGVHEGTFGRGGEGPGEMTSPIRIESAGDSVLVWDLRSSRILAWNTRGEFVGTTSVEFRPNLSFQPHARRLHGGGWLYSDPQPPEPEDVVPGEQVSGSTPIFRWDGADGWHEPALLELPGIPTLIRELPHGGLSAEPLHFAPEPQWAAAGADALWALDTDVDSVRLVGIDGTPRLALPLEVTPRPVTAADEAWLRDRLASVPGATPGEAADTLLDLPETHPPVTGMRADSGDRVWLRVSTESDEIERWAVRHVDPARDFEIRLPPRAHLLRVDGERILVRESDELGVHRVLELMLPPGEVYMHPEPKALGPTSGAHEVAPGHYVAKTLHPAQ